MSEAYREASSVLDLVLRRKASLKAAALAPSVRNKRRAFALAIVAKEDSARGEINQVLHHPRDCVAYAPRRRQT